MSTSQVLLVMPVTHSHSPEVLDLNNPAGAALLVAMVVLNYMMGRYDVHVRPSRLNWACCVCVLRSAAVSQTDSSLSSKLSAASVSPSVSQRPFRA